MSVRTGFSRSWPAKAGPTLLAAILLIAGFLSLVHRPFRIAPIALVLALTAAVMTREQQGLVRLAVAVVGICFVVGAAIAVIFTDPLY